MSKKHKKYNLVELFSGIGSQIEALEKIGADVEVLNTCEWNYHSILAYSLMHNNMDRADIFFEGTKLELVDYLLTLGISNDGKNPINKAGLTCLNSMALQKIYRSIKVTNNLVDISKVKGEDLSDNIDILTYSFPCQDLSNVGAFHGYKQGIDRDAHNRSGLLWEVERILLERKKEDLYLPHFLLMENVPALNSYRHRKNFEEWQEQLQSLGYYNKQYLLNASDFGLPQNRERLFMLSILTYNDPDIEVSIEEFFKEHDLENIAYRKSLKIEEPKLKNFLRTDYRKKKYKDEAIESQPNATQSRKDIWEDNLKLTDAKGRVKDTFTATITTKQDRNPNSGNLRVNFNNGKAEFRYLTPRECFLLMGFLEEDYDKLLEGNFYIKKNAKVFTRDNLIKMAGNSIAVNVLEEIFRQVIDLDEMLFL